MRRALRWLSGVALASFGGAAIGYFAILPNLWTPPPPRDFSTVRGDAGRGAVLVRAGGCVACHTDTKGGGEAFDGGPALKTPFGIFYAPNITPHETAGIGSWTLEQFSHALVNGVSPGGTHYFPAFPYDFYARMTARDVADLKAYLDTVSPSDRDRPNRPHRIGWPFSDRKLVAGWKWLYFPDRPFTPVAGQSAEWNRGYYLVSGPSHCGACHTQRNLLGGLTGRALAGSRDGADNKPVPSLRSDGTGGLSGWSLKDIVFGLQTGLTPEGDVAGGAMGKVISEGTTHLPEADLRAIAVYLKSPTGQAAK